MNDIWSFNISSGKWAWVNLPGSNDVNSEGNFPANVGDTGLPRARCDYAYWISLDQELFIFGGLVLGGKFILSSINCGLFLTHDLH